MCEWEVNSRFAHVYRLGVGVSDDDPRQKGAVTVGSGEKAGCAQRARSTDSKREGVKGRGMEGSYFFCDQSILQLGLAAPSLTGF